MLTLKTPAAAPAISRETAKAFCRVEGTEDDSLFDLFVAAATSAAEAETNRALITQTWVKSFDYWPKTSQIPIEIAPLQAIVSISYINTAGTTVVIDEANYITVANANVATVIPGINYIWPTDIADRPDAIRIEFTAGYGASETAVPEPIRHWMMVRVSTMNEYREQFLQGTLAVLPPVYINGLLDPYRLPRYA